MRPRAAVPLTGAVVAILAWVGLILTALAAQQKEPVPKTQPDGEALKMGNSYLNVQEVPFKALFTKLSAAKPDTMRRQMALLNERYDLSDRPARDIFMDRKKPIQEGVRVRLPEGLTWEQLAGMSPEEVKQRDLFPKGFMALPHVSQPEDGMVFPKTTIDDLKRQTGRDLARFDVDFDIPERFLAEFPPAIYLTTRPDLGDVSQGQFVTTENYYHLFNGILNPKQLDGLRLLVTPFPQQQFNLTDDRKSQRPSLPRLPCQRGHERRLSPGAGRSAAGSPASRRYSRAPRGQYTAAFRLAAGFEDGGRFHSIRATIGLF